MVKAILAKVELWKRAVQRSFAGSGFVLGLLVWGVRETV
jgi:hypothetical protein